jgi:hypothetical protein
MELACPESHRNAGVIYCSCSFNRFCFEKKRTSLILYTKEKQTQKYCFLKIGNFTLNFDHFYEKIFYIYCLMVKIR